MAEGQSRISKDDYVEGAPELIVEIAASTASYDLHDKKQVYRRNQVQEYLVWRTLDQALDWFVLAQGIYVDLPIDSDGVLRSRIFPGLWLSVEHLLLGDLATTISVLNQGLASSAHQAFRQSLAEKMRGDRDQE